MRRFHRRLRKSGNSTWAVAAGRAKTVLREITKRLTVARVAFVLLGIPLAIYIYREVTRDVLVIDPIAVPKRFEEAGFTPQVMANRLGDRLQEIEKSTQTSMRKDVLGTEQELAIPEIEIPGTKLGLKSLVDVGRSIFGRHPKHIGADVVLSKTSTVGPANDSVDVTAYFLQEQVGRQSLSGTVASGDVSDIVQRIAELALRQVNPYVLGRYVYDQKKFDQAELIAEKMTQDISLDKEYRKAAFNLWGDALDDEGKHEAAIAKYEKAIELDPKFTSAYNNWGTALDSEGKYQEAIAKYAKATELDPKNAKIYSNWGNALDSEGNHQEAIAKYAKAIEFDPKYAEAYINWGVALDHEGKYEEAIGKYAKAIELDPKFAQAYNDWGVALYAERKYEDATGKYAKAIELNPKYASAYLNWGMALYGNGKYEGAIEKYAKAIEINPKYAEAYNNWGGVLYAEGRYKEAIEKSAKAVEVNPKYALAFRNWGKALQRLGREKEANEKFSIADKLEPSH